MIILRWNRLILALCLLFPAPLLAQQRGDSPDGTAIDAPIELILRDQEKAAAENGV